MEPEGSLPYSQEPSIGPYLSQTDPVHTIPSHVSKIYFNIIFKHPVAFTYISHTIYTVTYATSELINKCVYENN
jgi:hypothetical protein